MQSRRSKLEICIDMLSKIKSGERKPTRIRYKANLSLRTFNQIIASLRNQGMIEVIDSKDRRSRVLYGITEKGEDVLMNFDRGQSLLELVDTSTL